MIDDKPLTKSEQKVAKKRWKLLAKASAEYRAGYMRGLETSGGIPISCDNRRRGNACGYR